MTENIALTFNCHYVYVNSNLHHFKLCVCQFSFYFSLPFQTYQVHVNFFSGVVTQDNAFAQFRKLGVSGQVGDGPTAGVEQRV